MAITTIDPQTALVVIDLQKGIKAIPTTQPVQEIIEQAAELAAAFRELKLPVVLVTVEGTAPGRTEVGNRMGKFPPELTELVPELNAQPSDIRISKSAWGAFYNTPLHSQLQKLGVTQIVLTGVSTSAGVESTARAAHELGYNVTFAIDAMTDANAEAHENSIKRIFPRLGETGSTQEILQVLRASH